MAQKTLIQDLGTVTKYRGIKIPLTGVLVYLTLRVDPEMPIEVALMVAALVSGGINYLLVILKRKLA